MFDDQNSTPETYDVEHDDCKVIQWTGDYTDLLYRRAAELAGYFPTASEIREVSIVWGPAVQYRNYRVTYGTPGNYHVSDWHIVWESTDSDTINSAEEFDRIM
jgi:hypothetical protein